jgi:hypothetical protein
VLEHGGRISVLPETETGTCFLLVLPGTEIHCQEQKSVDPASTGSQQTNMTGSSSA